MRLLTASYASLAVQGIALQSSGSNSCFRFAQFFEYFVVHSSHQFKTSIDMFSESYQIASYIVFISGVLGILGALAEFTFLRAFVHFKVLRALLRDTY